MRRGLPDETEGRPEGLRTATIKLPPRVERIWSGVAADCDLAPSAAYRVALTKLAETLDAHWRRGLSLSGFLEGLRFDGEQLDLFLDVARKRK